jgi:uncharacterized protein with von Willebrand factor type A (vWA) domain
MGTSDEEERTMMTESPTAEANQLDRDLAEKCERLAAELRRRIESRRIASPATARPIDVKTWARAVLREIAASGEF